MDLWIVATLAAAGIQTLRFMLQKQLKAAGLSTGAATFSRFLFAAPLAMLLAAALVANSGLPMPGMPARFWGFALAGGLLQIIATLATVALFSERNFAVGIAFTKTETVLVAIFSLVILGEAVGWGGFAAILVGVSGVILLSRPPGDYRNRLVSRASLLGLAAGAGFGLSAIGYRGAALALEGGGSFQRATLTLAVVTTSQSLAMAVWLRLREPGALTEVLENWRITMLTSAAGMLGSLGWFTAFTLQNAAYVRALGQVELVFSVLVARLVFNERTTRHELAGILLIAISIVLIVLLT